MKHGVLFGAYEMNIDEKNRLAIPSEVRKSLDPERDGNQFFLIVGENRKTWMYPDKYYEALVAEQEAELMPDEDALAFDHLNFASAYRQKWDEQGRIVVPAKLLDRTETGKRVTLIGSRDHLEIWNRDEWDEREKELDKRRKEIARTVRESKRAKSSENGHNNGNGNGSPDQGNNTSGR